VTIDINEFENRFYDHLATGLVDHYRAQLALKHGRRWLARRWHAELKTRLDRNLPQWAARELRPSSRCLAVEDFARK